MKALSALLRWANAAAILVAGIAILLMAAHVSLDAAGKYLLSVPIPATLEVVGYYYMPAVVALPLALVEIKNQHVTVDILYAAMGPAAQRVTRIVNGLVSIAFLGVIAWLAAREAIRKWDIGEYMFGEYPIIIWPGRFVFFAGIALFAIVVVARVIGLFLSPVDQVARLASTSDGKDAA